MVLWYATYRRSMPKMDDATQNIDSQDHAFEKAEKKKRAHELIVANIELAYQNEQKEQRAQELIIANKELAYQNNEKEKRAAELEVANKELAFQNEQKAQRAHELIVANIELAYQNEQKGQRAEELIIANKELAYQNQQKEKRAAELHLANKELAFQNEQKGQRAHELIVANLELAYQNEQKEQRAQELIIANQELAYQNELKELRAAELVDAIKELDAFAYVSSHHLQEPLRKIQSFTDKILQKEAHNLSPKGKYNFERIDVATSRMSQLIQDIYTYSRINILPPDLEYVSIGLLLDDVIKELQPKIISSGATIEHHVQAEAPVIVTQFREVLRHLIDNAIKFSRPGTTPKILVTARSGTFDLPALLPGKRYCHIEVKDEGIGLDIKYTDRIYQIFQKLHTVEEYGGTGIGLALVKKIMDRHNGFIDVVSEPGMGAGFHLYLPL